MQKKRLCPVCQEPILGRVDKKFCSDACRNSYNNVKYSATTKQVQRVNRALKRNHQILKKLNVNGKTKVSRSKLLQEGFDFTFITQVYETQKGHHYRLCYDVGYLALSEDLYLLINWQEN